MRVSDWDRLADRYADQLFDIFSRDRRHIVAGWMRQHGFQRRRHTVLDAGCGIGSFILQYGRHFGETIGADHSRRMLQIAARRCAGIPRCRWLRADVNQLPQHVPDGAHLVVCANVITFASPVECRRAMRSLVRCAKVGGWLLVVLPALESHDATTAHQTGRSVRRPPTASAMVRRDDRLQRFFTASGARQLAAHAGLRAARLHKVWHPWVDEGVTRAPRAGDSPWCWMLTGRR
jgi:ubiquinone/menaquinone biosynthesis C-methylase UbiE